MFRASVLGLAVLLSACAGPEKAAQPAAEEYAPEPEEEDEVTTAESGVSFEEVGEALITQTTPDENVDSPASWRTPSGATWVIATAKATDRLMVYDGDTGATLRIVGGSGEGAGEFNRPNGVFVIDDLVFVVERDNRRVQALRLPDFTPLGSFGTAELQKPYGLWVRRHEDAYEVLVSDAYMSAEDDDVPPPLADLDRRFKRYQVRVEPRALQTTLLGTFGATDAAGAIRIPESIWGDEAHARLLISEEDQSLGTRLRVYGMDGNYAGRDLGAGVFHAQAEGMALWQCPDGSGYWIATDQYKDRSVFHVFDRVSLERVGAFAGRKTANTDGVWLQQDATNAFPRGVFYAVDDDQAVAAFDWRQIAAALKLRETCG
jgi:3-phytase